MLSADQEICIGQIPDEIIGGAPQDGDGAYTLFWEEKTEGASVWDVISGETGKNLILPNLNETMYYRRTVLSDDCTDISDPIKINVLPAIFNDFIDTTLLIYTCYDTPPPRINGSTPNGGNGTYLYQWQESSDGLAWGNIASNSTTEDYQAIALTSTAYYRRLVFSGINDCCSSISDTIQIDINPLPEATIVSLVDTICSEEEINLDFTFNSGKSPYTLTYTDGENNFTPSAINNVFYNPTVTPNTALESKLFDYAIVSVIDDNTCEATNISGLAKVNVYGLPTSDAGIDDESCIFSYQFSAIASLGSGTWTQFSGTGNTIFENETNPTSNLTTDLAGLYIYNWKETNWHCEDSADVQIAFYEKPYNIKVSPDDTSLFFIDELTLKGYYETPDNVKEIITTWEILVGSSDDFGGFSNDSIINFTSLNDLGNEEIIITWTVGKGVCEDTVLSIPVKIKELFTPTGFTPNGDGVNDFLKFNGIENSDENELIIFNRWGTEVYRMKNYSNDMGWDGKNNKGKELPEDTYYYVLNVTDDGVSQMHKGFIVIKRY